MDPAFLAPPADCRPRPFWFWNAPLDAERIRAQVAAMAAGGCGGFFLHPRQGMTVPYLSAAYLDLVAVAVEAAAAHGLEAWLYDEFPYPSGNAAGLVTVDPALRARELRPRVVEVEGPFALDLPLGVLRCALAVPLGAAGPDWAAAVDVRAHAGVVFTDDEYWRWRLPGCPYNEERYLTAAPALRLAWTPPGGRWRLIALVEHERTGFKYFDRLVDTVAPGAAEALLATTHERYRARFGDHFGRTVPGIFTDEVEPPHWSPHLLPALAEQGFDPARDGAALACDDHPAADRWRHAVHATALAQFRTRWEAPVAAWCARHGLRWVAEKPAWTVDQLGASHVVGIDAGHVRADREPPAPPAMLRANPRAAQAVAAQRGSGEVVVECFHSLGWGARLLDQRWGFSWLGVQGGSRFTPHAFYAGTAGLRKHDAPPSFFLGTPAWPCWRALADDTARWSWALSRGAEPAEAAVLHPATPAACSGGAVAGEAFAAILAGAAARHRIVHPVDGATLRADGGLWAGVMRYPALLVPALTVAGAAEDQAVRTASAAGVPVWLQAPPPARAVEGAEPAGWTNLPGVRVVADPWPLLAPPRLRLDDGAGVLATLRVDGPRTLVLLANPGADARRVRVAVAGCGDGWAAWDTADGAATALAGTTPWVDLPPWGRALLLHGGPAVPVAVPLVSAPLPADGWTLDDPGPTWLRLDQWRFGDGPAQAPRPRRWRDANAWQWRDLDGGGATMRATAEVVCAADIPAADLVIELGAIVAGAHRITLDGRPLPAAESCDLLGGDRTRIPLGPLAAGTHRLEIDLDAVPALGGLTGPLHLHGRFGVDAMGRLTAPPATAPLLDPHPPGLPFHTGPLAWTRTWDPGAATAVDLPLSCREAVVLEVDGVPCGVRAWPPYRWPLPPGHGPRRLRLRVHGTLLPLFTGTRWDDATATAVPVVAG